MIYVNSIDTMLNSSIKLGEKRREFWKFFLGVANRTTDLFGTTAPTCNDWIQTASGKPGLYYACKVAANDTKVMLNITRAKFGDEKQVLDRLKEYRAGVEASFGRPLEWFQGRKGPICRVMKVLPGGGYRNRDDWETISRATIKAMLRLKSALDPYVRSIKL